jgi:TonB family protein
MKDQHQASPQVMTPGLRRWGWFFKNGLLASLLLHAFVLLIVIVTTSSRPLPKSVKHVRVFLNHHGQGSSGESRVPTQAAPRRGQSLSKRPLTSPRKDAGENEVSGSVADRSKVPSLDAAPQQSAQEAPSVEGQSDSSAKGGQGGGGGHNGNGTGSGESASGQGYDGVILAHIRERQFYPQTARRNRLEGVVWVDISIRADGALLESTLSQSSGHGVLDQAALDIVARCDPFPPMPSEISGISMKYRVPIAFELRHKAP